MSDADKLFEELGYTIANLRDYIVYSLERNDLSIYVETRIIFDLKNEEVQIKDLSEEIWLTPEELKAINKKCEELRME